MEYIEYHAHMVEQWGARAARGMKAMAPGKTLASGTTALGAQHQAHRAAEAKRTAAAAARARADAEAPKAEARGCSRAALRR